MNGNRARSSSRARSTQDSVSLSSRIETVRQAKQPDQNHSNASCSRDDCRRQRLKRQMKEDELADIVDRNQPSQLTPNLSLPCTFLVLPRGSMFLQDAWIAPRPCRHCSDINARNPHLAPLPCVISAHCIRCLLCIVTATTAQGCSVKELNPSVFGAPSKGRMRDSEQGNRSASKDEQSMPLCDRLSARLPSRLSDRIGTFVQDTSEDPSYDLKGQSRQIVATDGESIDKSASSVVDQDMQESNDTSLKSSGNAEGQAKQERKRARNDGAHGTGVADVRYEQTARPRNSKRCKDSAAGSHQQDTALHRKQEIATASGKRMRSDGLVDMLAGIEKVVEELAERKRHCALLEEEAKRHEQDMIALRNQTDMLRAEKSALLQMDSDSQQRIAELEAGIRSDVLHQQIRTLQERNLTLGNAYMDIRQSIKMLRGS